MLGAWKEWLDPGFEFVLGGGLVADAEEVVGARDDADLELRHVPQVTDCGTVEGLGYRSEVCRVEQITHPGAVAGPERIAPASGRPVIAVLDDRDGRRRGGSLDAPPADDGDLLQYVRERAGGKQVEPQVGGPPCEPSPDDLGGTAGKAFGGYDEREGTAVSEA
jgi:hypothetical protein